jgi:hypothetical protein
MKSLVMAVLTGFAFLQGQAAYVGIHAAASQGDLARLKQYLADDPHSISSRNGPGRSPLCIAAMCGQTNAVEFLLSQGADVNDRGFQGMTPLADMAAYGTTNDQRCAEVAAILLAHGAEVDPLDSYKDTPLLHAVESEKNRLARVLLEHGARLTPTYAGANSGMTPLHMAVMDGDQEMVKVLLEFKAPLDLANRDGATPLLLAEQQNKTEIAAMLRQANPAAAQGIRTYSIAPTKDEMRGLAKRIAEGDDLAFEELASTSEKLYGEIKDYQKEHARVMVLLFRMKAAFDVLGENAGRGNEKALQALKKCLGRRTHLQAFAPDALGIAAAAGNQEALDILLHYDEWGILESSARFALCVPAKANVGPAVDYFVTWLSTTTHWDLNGGLMIEATNALAGAAVLGNPKAKDALAQFAISHPAGNEQSRGQ